MVGTVLFIGVVVGIIILCICCLTSTCPCYYNKLSHELARAIQSSVAAQPQVVAMTTKTTNDAAYPEPPPPYNPDQGYVHQPYPPAPPPVYPDYPTEYPNY